MSRSARQIASGARGLHFATSPLLASKTPPWRSRFVVAMVGLAFIALIARAVYIQILASEFFQMQGEKRYAHTLKLPGSRGNIYDRNGLLLAASVPTPSLWITPKDFQANVQQREALARLLALKPNELDERLDSDKGFAWLRRQVDTEVAKQVMALGIKGLYQVREYKREYPAGDAAAQVVGHTKVEGDGIEGTEGIELAFESELQGRNGSRFVVKDRLGRVVEDIVEQTDPINGSDVHLALDSKVQFFAYQRVRDAVMQHAAKSGSVVVLDVASGEVLALANYHNPDPSRRARNAQSLRRNTAIVDFFEPGSTMKPFTISLALDKHIVTPATRIQTAPGRIMVGNRTISDAHPHGELSVAEVIQKSSNVGTVKIAFQMQPQDMLDMYASLGFGRKPEIEFPGAVGGRVRPFKPRSTEHATMSYGYGLSTSLFQLAHAYTAFARDGELVPLSLIKREGDGADPVPGQRVFTAETARAMRQMLQMAAAPGGTAQKAMATGYSVGGKSGTVRKQEGKTYVNKYRGWFVGLAPLGKPRIVVAVMIDEPTKGKYFGGDIAAPVFSQVVHQTLRTMNVVPDLEVKSGIVNKPLPPVVADEEESI